MQDAILVILWLEIVAADEVLELEGVLEPGICGDGVLGFACFAPSPSPCSIGQELLEDLEQLLV